MRIFLSTILLASAACASATEPAFDCKSTFADGRVTLTCAEKGAGDTVCSFEATLIDVDGDSGTENGSFSIAKNTKSREVASEDHRSNGKKLKAGSIHTTTCKVK